MWCLSAHANAGERSTRLAHMFICSRRSRSNARQQMLPAYSQQLLVHWRCPHEDVLVPITCSSCSAEHT